MNNSLTEVMAMLGLTGTPGNRKTTHKPKPRPCLNCGARHTHNNAYCTAHCCKEHREQMKNQPKEKNHE